MNYNYCQPTRHAPPNSLFRRYHVIEFRTCLELLDSCLQDLHLSSILLDTTFTSRGLHERLLLQDDRDITFWSAPRQFVLVPITQCINIKSYEKKISEPEVTQEFKFDTILNSGLAMLHCDHVISSAISKVNKKQKKLEPGSEALQNNDFNMT